MYLYLIIAFVVVLAVILFFNMKRAGKSADKRADPIAEADIYIAYGKKEEAKKVLKKALVLNPNDSELKKKLDSI